MRIAQRERVGAAALSATTASSKILHHRECREKLKSTEKIKGSSVCSLCSSASSVLSLCPKKYELPLVVPQRRMLADNLAQQRHLILEVAAAVADAQMKMHAPALEPARLAILRARNHLGQFSASQHCRRLPRGIGGKSDGLTMAQCCRTSALRDIGAGSCVRGTASPSNWSR